MTGVEWAVPLYKGLLKARLDNGTFQTCNVYGLDDTTLAAALLHDAVEDTRLTLKDVERDFGPQVAELAGQIVTRLTRSFRQSVNVELPVHARRGDGHSSCPEPVVVAADDVPHRLFSPFQFRLPPPAL